MSQQQGGDMKKQHQELGQRVIATVLIGGPVLTLATMGATAFGAVAIPVILLAGGLLLLVSPLLIGGAVLTSPLWVPIVGTLLAIPPILGTIATATAAFVFAALWAWNFIRSGKLRAAAGDLTDGAKEATSAVQHRVWDLTKSVEHATQEARERAQQAGQEARERAQSATSA